ncbi:phage tail tape measure protein [Nocardia wallacei]|uniref:phage tail tape measure protein n=1 Tax=Nocardia wallacei TaxID=480035 RepID=UPI0024542553|nr:phage tail tape measure protein [Nocardia wallacei]
MAQDVLAYTTLQVIPSMRGAASTLEGELSGLGAVGRSAGREVGKGVARGISDSKADVERASAVVVAARDKEADAAGKVRVAEARLEELRDSGKAKASQLARAEEQLATALRGREAASRTAANAAQALEDANKRAADSVSKIDVGGGLLSGLSGKLSGIGDKLSSALSGASREAGEESGGQIASGIGDKLGEMLGGKAGLIGSTVAAAVSLAGLSAPGLLFAGLNRGLQNQQALDLTQARLGVDDSTMHKIGAAAGRAYTGAFGSSIAENADTARRAIQSGVLDPNATGQETQRVIEQLSGVSGLLGEEIPAVSRAAGQAIKTGIAGSATEAFDLFVAAERNGLNVSEDFLDTITEYSTQFRKLGLSGPEALGLVNQAVRAGARDSDIAADAIKEFSIRVVDGSKLTTGAFQDLGFNADDLTKRFATGGTTARAAVGELLGEIRKIEDPVKKNEIALALFGTQFEDLGDALNTFNLDNAAASLGKVGGAAADALGQMGGNAATSLEGAKRSIEVSVDAISNALAQAFGPQLAKLADWVTRHQPEILGFLGQVADGAFAAGDAFLGFSSMGLRALAAFAEGAGSAIGSVTGPLGRVTELFGKITGNTDLANLGASVADLDNKFLGAADKARGMADSIDLTARPALDRMRTSISDNIAAAQNSQLVYQALGNTVATLPDGHTITLQDNTPETTARLEALGLKVTTLPNGQVTVTANTAEGQRILDDFVNTNTGRKINVEANVLMRAIAGDPGAVQQVQVGGVQQLWPAAPGRATGGIVPGLAGGGLAGRTLEGRLWGPGTGTSDSILGVDANGIPTARVSPGEGVVKYSAMNRGGDKIVAALNRGWVPPAAWLRDMVRGGARLAHGRYDPSLRGLGIEESSPVVAAVLGLRSLLAEGNYTSNLRDATGLEEDSPLVSGVLGARSLLAGDYDPRLRQFGIEEDNALVDLGLGVGGFGRGQYLPNLRRFGIEEDNPLVDAGIGLGGLLHGDYRGNLRRFGLEEDNPLVTGALDVRRFLANLPGFAGGGIVPGKNAATQLDPAIYEMGGFSSRAIDCSALVSAVVNDATGRPMFESRMSTVSAGEWLRARGALPGLGGPGDIAVAWYDRGGGPNGHMTMRLGDGTKVESRSGDGVVVGSAATDVTNPMFDQHMYIPKSALLGGDLGGAAISTPGAGLLTNGGGASGGGTGGGGAAGGSAGGAGASAGRPQGQAVPVWVDNWPGSFGAAASTGSGASRAESSASTASSFAPAGGPPEAQQFDQQAAVQTALTKGRDAFSKAGESALRGQLEAIPGASSLFSGLEKQAGTVQFIVADVAEAVNRWRGEQQRQAMSAGSRF